MTRNIHYLTLQYLRGIRAYHLRKTKVIKEEESSYNDNEDIIKAKFAGDPENDDESS